MNRVLLSVFLFALVLTAFVAAQEKPIGNPLNEPLGSPGIIPAGPDAKPLNLNFESGTLDGWKAEGEAFTGQPIKGDIAELRPADRKKSEHTGQFWIGTYEKAKDLPQGTLTSPTFDVTHPYASFLIGGGSSRQTRVDIVTADDNRVVYGASGQNQENLRPVIVDLRQVQGRKIFIRIIDQASGGWGHINFDDFRFHDARPRFKSLASELPTPEATALYPHAGLSPEEAAKNMIVPPGFSVQVAAAEPDVQQPVAMAIDDRGRIWIAEALQYPRRAAGDKGADRILVFEDTDLNGTLDKRTVFYEGLNLVSGLEVGFGGVWVGAAPYLLFIPDKDGDDKPDSEPVKLLDGWGYEDTHETLNSFIWGPDGWLYGCHGVFTHSKVGKPGTPADKRVLLNAGIWRYHPVRHEFEVFAHGTSNPWGLDYDQYGNFFATACVIPHIFHIIPGARYERQAGQHFNPYTYDDIKTIADHRHYTGNQWNDGNRLQSDTLGGGHAHAGCMIYQGGAWPEKYRGAVFMNNIHGNRMNVDLLEPHGSGFVAHHGQDFLLTRDQWSQMLSMTYGPDGQVYVIDWYDRQQCHLREPDKHDRSNGRIFRIVYDNAKPVKVDLQKLSDLELVRLLEHKNEWYPRHAQRILQERAAAKTLMKNFELTFGHIITPEDDEKKKLRMSWTTHVTIGLDAWISAGVRGFDLFNEANALHFERGLLFDLMEEDKWSGPHYSGWHIRLFLESHDELHPNVLTGIGNAAAKAPSQAWRRYLAAELQNLPVNQRWSLLETLTGYPEDATDHNLPLMYWYAMEPLADVDAPRALALALSAGENIPILKEFMIRKIGAGDPEKSLALLIDGLKQAKDDPTRLTFLRGLNESLKGRRDVKAPAGWQEVFTALNKSATGDLKIQLSNLAVAFGDEKVIESLRLLARDPKHSIEERRAAIRTLVSAKAPNTSHILRHIVNDEPALRTDAIRGLATFDDENTPTALLRIYSDYTPDQRRDALAALATRPTYAVALLDAVAAGKVPNNHLTADLVTNLRNLNDEALNKRIEQVWGIVRTSPADKAKQIEDYKRLIQSLSDLRPLTSDLRPLELGRAVFAKTCQQCHTLFGTGGKVGPDITGSQRANLDYVLSNILDPSAVMAKEYQPTIVRCLDGRIVTGILKEETPAAISLQTQNELVVLSKADIEERKISEKSMMPDDLLKPLTQTEVRSLVAYLGSEGQTPMQATADNFGGFFNGKDLTGWRGDEKLWSVENGEIVGKTTGLRKNEFLMSELSCSDFRLELDVKLVADQGNSGIQIRSQAIENGLMRGYQCDIGPGWWGKLYEEHGRALLESKGGEEHVKKGDWNHYEIIAVGSRVRTFLNGHLSVDRDDPFPLVGRASGRPNTTPLPPGEGTQARSASEGPDSAHALPYSHGLIGLQLHSGGPTEVRFKNLKLTLITPPVPARPYPASRPVAHRPEAPAGDPAARKVTFKKLTLDRAFRSEGVGMGDFNNDGLLDISSGSVWYENPGVGRASGRPETLGQAGGLPHEETWTMHVLGAKANSFDIKTYGDTFMNWAEDVDGDGRQDLIVVDFPGKQTWWFQNPGPTQARSASEGSAGLPWKKHALVPVTNNESPQYADVDGDGRRELIYGDGSKRLALARPGANPLLEWQTTHVAAPGDVNMVNFYHGLGIGDVNGDGRNDLLVPNGWWETPVTATTGRGFEGDPWTFHTAPFGQPQAQMYVYDFDGDGDNDVVGSSAHRRGIWWYEQDGKDWKTHLIDESIAQTHALILADMNGDGLPDLVTGKRYYAHNGRDPGEDEPPEIAWYELSRGAGVPPAEAGQRPAPRWTKHLIDSDSGVGTQFEVHDMNADGLLDIIVANKRGVFYFEQQR